VEAIFALNHSFLFGDLIKYTCTNRDYQQIQQLGVMMDFWQQN
jgi:hypothetical protein